MKRVNTLKHLGVHIDNQGNLPHDKNILPLTNTMEKIADSFNSSMCTPLGRSIYAKYLLGSKYLHRVQTNNSRTYQIGPTVMVYDVCITDRNIHFLG